MNSSFMTSRPGSCNNLTDVPQQCVKLNTFADVSQGHPLTDVPQVSVIL